jgi:hypothetical protein
MRLTNLADHARRSLRRAFPRLTPTPTSSSSIPSARAGPNRGKSNS